MLIGFDTRPCSLSVRDSSMFKYEMTSKYIALKNVFIQKSIFVDFFSFNPNRVMGINVSYFPAICWVCFQCFCTVFNGETFVPCMLNVSRFTGSERL